MAEEANGDSRMRVEGKTLGCRPNPLFRSRSWASAHTGQASGCAPNSLLRSRPWVATQTGLKRRLSPRLFRISGSFKNSSCAGWNGRVPGATAIAANAAAARCSRFGFGPARKKTLAVSHHSLDVVLNAAHWHLHRKLFCWIGPNRLNWLVGWLVRSLDFIF